MTETLSIHHEREAHPDTSLPDTHQDRLSTTVLGFWIYLMTDCILFASLFISYAVLSSNTFGGITSKELYHLSTTFKETMVLLFSSFTCGLAMIATVKDKDFQIKFWLFVTFLLGAFFLYSEVTEFSRHVANGNGWTESAFLSSYFGLVGTHGLHIAAGLVWLAVLIGQIFVQGINVDTFRRLVIFTLFWHFVDLIWIFVFSLVYLMGVI